MVWSIGHDDNGEALVWTRYFQELLGHVVTAVGRLQSKGLYGPWVVMITLTGLKGYRIFLDHHERSDAAWRYTAYLGEIIAETVDATTLDPLIAVFWRLLGIEH